MRPLLLMLVMFTIFIAGCTLNVNKPDKLWFYTYSSSSKGKTTLLTPVSFLSLEPNGSYTRDFGTFDYGTWRMKDNAIHLTNYKKEISILPINYFAGNEIKFGTTNASIDNFESRPGSFTNADENPFSKENNLWRIKAERKETEEEIKKRLLNHFRFWETYFTWALNNQIPTIDVRSTPTLIKIYGNGFTLKPYDKLPEQWRSYFFDEEDCRKANDMVQYIFENDNIAWPHTDDKYKMFISAFQQLYQKVRQK